MPWLAHLLALIHAPVADRSRLALEITALRQEITVLERSSKRVKDRRQCPRLLCPDARLLASWRESLLTTLLRYAIYNNGAAVT